MPRGGRREGLRRGIYFVPSSFTVGNIFCGFYAIIASMQGRLELAAMLIGLAILLDTLDGRVARMANAASEFGREFDSLADVISFGVAPGVLAYIWGLHLQPRLGWLACFLYVISGALRLARFNIQQTAGDKRFFAGLPIPAAAGVFAALVFMFPEPLTERGQALLALVLILALATLMVSTIRYYSFKDIDLRKRRPYVTLLLVALFIVAIGAHPPTMLLSLASAYLLSGPSFKAYQLLKRRRVPAAPEEALVEGRREQDG